MYINKVHINNIRSIQNFDMNFDNHAGWHVIIGDNGAGKSTIIRSIALALVGPDEAPALRQNWSDWLRKKEEKGRIDLKALENKDHDNSFYINQTNQKSNRENVIIYVSLKRKSNKITYITMSTNDSKEVNAKNHIWNNSSRWFSASYGPFRRFTGGNKDWEKLYASNPKLAAHLSAFGEDIALTECVDWLVKLNYKRLENKIEGEILNDLSTFINHGDLLPHQSVLHEISSDGVFFKDGNDNIISITELSDGYRSVLSLIFELIRNLVLTYGKDKVFENIRKGEMFIDLPGVVLIDEIDAHLHPTWQVKIGQWFLKYFPSLQFIVTTHSPLICHAAEKGSVWQLATPGSETPSRQIKGIELQRLIYGNVLEAFGTEAFGHDVTRSQASQTKLSRLARLNTKSILGKITKEEEEELAQLKIVLPTGK